MALSFSEDSLQAAGSAVDRLDALFAALATYRCDCPDDATLAELLDGTKAAFETALDDDLNISPAQAALFDLVRELNRRIDARVLSTADAMRATDFIRDLDRVLGIAPRRGNGAGAGTTEVAGRAGRRPGRSRLGGIRPASRRIGGAGRAR